MLLKGSMFLFNILMVKITDATGTVVLLNNYAVQVFKQTVLGKVVYSYLFVRDTLNSWFREYFKEIKTALRCRIYYKKITQPMKVHYKELKKK